VEQVEKPPKRGKTAVASPWWFSSFHHEIIACDVIN
jgi:hypothetical protein